MPKEARRSSSAAAGLDPPPRHGYACRVYGIGVECAMVKRIVNFTLGVDRLIHARVPFRRWRAMQSGGNADALGVTRRTRRCKKPALFAITSTLYQRCVVSSARLDPARVPRTDLVFSRSRTGARVRPTQRSPRDIVPMHLLKAGRERRCSHVLMPRSCKKRVAAKGRSPDTTTTTVLSRPGSRDG